MQATLLLWAAVAIGAPALKDRSKIDPDLIGEWVVVTITLNGTNLGIDSDQPLRNAYASDGKLTTFIGDKPIALTRHFDTNKRALPATIDLIVDEKTERGIYKIEKDTLTLCSYSGPDDLRPTEFTAPAGSQRGLLVLKRVKTKKD